VAAGAGAGDGGAEVDEAELLKTADEAGGCTKAGCDISGRVGER
jgi:hypothetical protein